MAAIASAAGSNNWNTNGAWVGGVQPTAADDVTITATTTVTIPTGVTALARSVTVSNTATLAFASTTAVLTIGDATAGAGSVAFSNAGTVTLTGIGTINFISTSATVQTVTSGGQTLPNLTFNAASNGSWQLADNNTSSGTVTLTKGTLDTNSKTCNWSSFFSNNANVRALTLGTSGVTVTAGSTPWVLTDSTNLTLSAASSTITLSGNSAVFNGGSTTLAYGTVAITGTGVSTINGVSSTTYVNFTRTSGASLTGAVVLAVDLSVSGTIRLDGNSIVNRLFVQSSVLGTQRTITAATQSASTANVDFQDIKGAGTASWNLAAISGGSGDCLGNSSITFTTQTTQTWNGNTTGNVSTIANWTSRTPLAQDTVLVTGLTSGTITVDVNRVGVSWSFAGSTGGVLNLTTSLSFFGSFTNATGVTFSGASGLQPQGRSSHTLTFAGATIPGLVMNAFGGTYAMQDAMALSGSRLTVTVGTLTTNNFNITSTVAASACYSFITGTTINCGTSTITAVGGGANPFSIGTGTINGASATFVITGVSTTLRSFSGTGNTFGTITYNVANSPGAVQIAGANTISTLNVGPGRILTLTSGVIQTVTNWNVSGVNNGYVYLPGAASNNLTSADSVPLSITGDIDIRVRVAADDWTPAAVNTLLSKSTSTSNQRSWQFILNTAGTIGIGWSTAGTGFDKSATSTVATGFADGTTNWLRFTLDVDNGAAGNDTKFYTASGSITNPTTSDWTQLGTTVTIAGTTNIFDSTTPVVVGTINADVAGGTLPATGKFYRAIIINNLLDNGTGIQYDADFSTKAFGANSTIDTSGNTIYYTGGTLRMFAIAGQYASAPDATALQISGDIDMRVRVAMTDWTPAGTQSVFAKEDANFGYRLSVNTTGTLRFTWSNNNSTNREVLSTAATGLSDTTVAWIRVTRASSSGTVKFYTSTTNTNDPTAPSWSQLGTDVASFAGAMFANITAPLSIGTIGPGTNNHANGAFYRAALYTTIDGSTPTFDADFTTTTAQTFKELSTNLALVTVNGGVTTTGSVAQAGDGRVTLNASTPGSAATLAFTQKAASDYITVQDNTASTTTPAYAGSNGVLVSNTTNWLAQAAPSAGSPNFLLLGVG